MPTINGIRKDEKRRKTHTYHYGSDWYERVVHAARLVDVAALEGHLQTAASHAETHRIHVDVIDKCCTVSRLWVGG
jgi:hypothetical protein